MLMLMLMLVAESKKGRCDGLGLLGTAHEESGVEHLAVRNKDVFPAWVSTVLVDTCDEIF